MPRAIDGLIGSLAEIVLGPDQLKGTIPNFAHKNDGTLRVVNVFSFNVYVETRTCEIDVEVWRILCLGMNCSR